MCRIEDCDRHTFDRGLCLTHLKEALNPTPKRRRKSRKKKVDAAELMTTDSTEVMTLHARFDEDGNPQLIEEGNEEG